jgi:hypothetical protein
MRYTLETPICCSLIGFTGYSSWYEPEKKGEEEERGMEIITEGRNVFPLSYDLFGLDYIR